MPDNGEAILAKMRAAFELNTRLDLTFLVRDPETDHTQRWALSLKPVES